jgi:ElaA protein
MIEWQWQAFSDIPVADLYQVLYQRQQVFVLEQKCLYPDIDGYDQGAHHLMAWHTVDGKRELAAYLRCIAPGVKYTEMSLGRVLTAPSARGTGIGRKLLEQGIARAEALHPGHRFRIGAQQYLEKFYASFGFNTVTAPYDEDGIMHIDMVR